MLIKGQEMCYKASKCQNLTNNSDIKLEKIIVKNKNREQFLHLYTSCDFKFIMLIWNKNIYITMSIFGNESYLKNVRSRCKNK